MREQVSRIYSDLKRIEVLREHSYSGRSLDLMFIIDCTGSMHRWIEVCKVEIKAIIAYVQTQFYKMKVRVSIIGYWDYYSSA